MPKDVNGTEINVGDTVEHIFGPWPEQWNADYRQNPDDPKWKSDGFAGRREVVELTSIGVIVNAIDPRNPHYLAEYCRVL